MTLYPKEFVELYIKYRHKLTATDPVVFGHVERMGLNGASVLDFGCGDGRYSALLKKNGAHSVLGIDNSPAMLEHAVEKYGREPGVQFLLADGTRMPLLDESFDLVFAHFSLHHFSDKETPLREIHRVLRPGGALVATLNAYEVHTVARHVIGTTVPILLHVGAGNDIGMDSLMIQNIVITHDQLEKKVRDAGFHIDWYEPVDNPNIEIDKTYPFYHQLKMDTMVVVAQKPK